MDLIFREIVDEKAKETLERYLIIEGDKKVNYLPKIGNINLFLGANNAGKSQFMRFLISSAQNLQLYREDIYISLNHMLRYYKEQIDLCIELINRTSHEDLSNPKSTLISFLFEIKKSIEYFDFIDIDSIRLKELVTISRKIQFYVKESDFLTTVSTHNNGFYKEFENFRATYTNMKSRNIIYIPVLRSAHTLYNDESRIEENIFKETYIKNYGLNDELDLFTGLDLYNQILNKRNSHSDDRKDIEAFEKFLSDNFFQGQKVEVIAKFNYDNALKNDDSERNIAVKIGDGDDRFLYELGDGIQSLIILLFKVFMAEENSIVFIDEPELYLHPGMQRIFFEQIVRNPDVKDKNLSFYITTHSNHLLDLTIFESGISIYTFTPKIIVDLKKFEIRNVNQGNNSILRELGVNNSSVFLANCSIWVEGISDRLIIRAMLYAYIMHKFNEDVSKFPKENIEFSFFEYAGSNIEHYVFDDDISDEMNTNIEKQIKALALNNRILLVADYDNATGKKKARIEKLKEINKVNFSFLVSEEFREIENILSKSIWKKVLIDFCNQNEVKKRGQAIQIAIESKIEGFKNFESYRKEYIGKFLEKLKSGDIPLNEICKKKSTGKGWGIFEDKAKLANLIYDKTITGEITWEDFIDGNEIIDGYVSQIYNFIKPTTSAPVS